MFDQIAFPATTYGERIFKIKQGDTHDPITYIARDQRGRVLSLIGATVQFIYRLQEDGSIATTKTATVLDAQCGQMKYQWVAGDTDIAGDYYATWKVTYADATTQTFPIDDFQSFTIEPAL